MTTTDMRASHSRNTRLQLAAWLAFISWLGVLGYFVGVPVLHWTRGTLPWPLVAGSACVVLIVVVLYYIVAQSQTCRVCGAPVFGGGGGHRKHPSAKKFLGISYSRQVAWEILTSPAYHCMHCHSLCRCRSGKSDLFSNRPDALPQSVFLPGGQTEKPAEPPVPAAAEQPPAPVPDLPMPIMPTVPPLAHAERPPWAHHPEFSPFVLQQSRPSTLHPTPMPPESMKPSNATNDGLPAFPEDLPYASMDRATAMPLPPRSVTPPAAPQPQPHFQAPMPQMPFGAAEFPPPAAKPAMPAAPMAAPPVDPPRVPEAPAQPRSAVPSPNLHQLVEGFARALAETRQTVDGAFEKLLGQLKHSVAALAQAPAAAPARPAAPPPPAPERSGNGTRAEAPQAATPVSQSTPADPQRAAQFNAVLAQAFAQQQRQPQPAPQAAPQPAQQAAPPQAPAFIPPPRPAAAPEMAPPPAIPAAPRPAVRIVPPPPQFAPPQPARPAAAQSPFTLVTPMPTAEATQAPAQTAMPFAAPQPPPATSPAAIAASVQRVAAAPSGIPQPPQVHQPAAISAQGAASPFAAVSALPEPPAQESPFHAVPSSHFTGAPFPAMSGAHVAPFSFLSTNGDSFVPDPAKAPNWVPPSAQQQPAPAAPDAGALPPWAQPYQS